MPPPQEVNTGVRPLPNLNGRDPVRIPLGNLAGTVDVGQYQGNQD